LIQHDALAKYQEFLDTQALKQQRAREVLKSKQLQIKQKVRDDVLVQTQKLRDSERFVLPRPYRSKGSSSPTRLSVEVAETANPSELKSARSFHMRSSSVAPEDTVRLHHRYWHERVKPDLYPEISERLKISLELRKEYMITRPRVKIPKAKLLG
jgi:hypothetical protein